MKLRTGDSVIVIAGKDKGKLGKITKILGKENKVIVEGINIQTRHVKPTQKNSEGGIFKEPAPISVSNVMFNIGDKKDPKKAQGTRIRIKKEKKANGRPLIKRIAVKTGDEI